MSKEGGGGTEKKQSTTGNVQGVQDQEQSGSSSQYSQSQEQTLLDRDTGQGLHETHRAGEGVAVPETSDASQIQSSPSRAYNTDSTKPDTRKAQGQALLSSSETHSRQVIAVSASKKPAVFFNLARKFLATNEECDLSALEGAILTAVDAAHLLERSKIATIVRVRTSYVSVEPKRKKQSSSSGTTPTMPPKQSPVFTDPLNIGASHQDISMEESERHRKSIASGRARGVPLRRARIVITVRRTRDYEVWLEETPYDAIIGGVEDLGEEDQSKLSQHRPKSPS